MASALSIFTSLLLGLLLSTTWITIAVLARLDSAVYLPQAFRFLGAAVVLLVLGLIFARRLPRISLRLFHAAITVAALAYVLSPVLCFHALKVLPSGLGALVYVSIPVWFLLAAYGEGKDKAWNHVLLVLGFCLVLYGSYPSASLRGGTALAVFTLFCGMGAFMSGVWVSRRLFWLHSAMDLNFWSMLFGGLAHFLLAITSGEFRRPALWTGPYWWLLAYFAIVVTGLGAYFYRVRQGTVTSVILTAITPIGAVVWGILAWEETPLDPFVGAGALLVVGVLVYQALQTRPNKWLVLYLNNDKRQGDRLMCMLQGTVAKADGVAHVVQVIDISIGGLGFRTSAPLEKGELVSVSIPVTRQGNSLTLDCKVAHCRQVAHRDFPYVGGLEFRAVSESRWQSLVEFLARLAKAEEE